MSFWDDLNKKLDDYGSWLEKFRWPLKPPEPKPKPPTPRAPAPPVEEDEEEDELLAVWEEEDEEKVEYDSTGRIISVPEGWEVEFTGTVSGYTGGKDNPFEEERITLLGAPGEISEADLMQQYEDEGHPKVYWGGSEVLELSSFSERAVEI